MIVEALGNVTFVNNILRIETLMIQGDGSVAPSGSIEIPGNLTGEVINQLAQATQGISEKLNSEISGDTKEETSKKDTEKKSKKKKN